MTYRVTIYREGSLTPVVYTDVKHVFWTANNTVLALAIFEESVPTGRIIDGVAEVPEHYYVSWPREQFAWYKIERSQVR